MKMLPTVIDGVPYWNDACPAYDINTCVCEILGHRPGNLCEPAVREVVAAVADLKDRLRLLAPFVCKSCGCAPVEIVTFDGELESDDVCADCFDTNILPSFATGDEAASSISRFCRAVWGRKLVP